MSGQGYFGRQRREDPLNQLTNTVRIIAEDSVHIAVQHPLNIIDLVDGINENLVAP